MTNIVMARRSRGSRYGVRRRMDSPLFNSGGSNVDYAVGAFTGLADLPRRSTTTRASWISPPPRGQGERVYDAGSSSDPMSSPQILRRRRRRERRLPGDRLGLRGHGGRGGDDQLFSDGTFAPATLDGGEGDDLLRGGNNGSTLLGGAGTTRCSAVRRRFARRRRRDRHRRLFRTSGANRQPRRHRPQLTGRRGTDTLTGIETFAAGSTRELHRRRLRQRARRRGRRPTPCRAAAATTP